MKSHFLAACMVIVLASAPPLSASSSSEITYTVDVGMNGWVAFRFNLSGPSDLVLHAAWEGCRSGPDEHETQIGFATFVIPDGDAKLYSLLGGSAWGLGSDMVHLNVAGLKSELPPALPEVSCDYGELITGPGAYHANASFTLVMMSLAPEGSVSLSARSSHGLASEDVATGTGMSMTKNDFRSGVHVNYYPVPVGVSAGVGMTAGMAIEQDHVGWFWPKDPQALGVSNSRCETPDGPCPTRPSGLHELVGNATAYALAIDAEAVAPENPYTVVGMVTLPDASYI